MTPFEKFAAAYTHKKILIFGLGLQGRGIGDARIFAEIGARVTVTDKKSASDLSPAIEQLKPLPINYTLGAHEHSDILNSDIIVRNASIPWEHPLLQLARQHHIPITTDEALFFNYAKPAKVIGITGTRGKTTTTSLIFHILHQANLPATVAGNLVPTASLELLKTFDPQRWYLFELSSWQLQAFHQIQLSPHISVITNIYPDHLLDRNYLQYIHDKSAIIAYQTPQDAVFLNQNNSDSLGFANQTKGQLHWFTNQTLPNTWTHNLLGKHNQENIKAALAVARYLNIAESIIETSLATFSPPPFRLQKIASINNIDVINDTTSTTPIATIKALETYPQSILICGGMSKKLPIKDLAEAINQLAKFCLLLPGTGTDELLPHLNVDKVLGPYSSLKQVVNQAFVRARSGDTILFSPGFTSFNLFANEFDRGRQFNQLITDHSKSKK